MPRNMSFSLTTEQYRNRTKTVTRRIGWWNLRTGDILNGVEKSMGLKCGEHMVVLGQHRVISVRREMLIDITPDDVVKEGFQEMTTDEFVAFFCATHGGSCGPHTIVNRIEFERI